MGTRLHLLAILAPLLLAACQTTGVRFPNETGLEVQAGIAKPEGKGPFPAVVLLHTCGGMQSHVRDDWPGYLKAQGYVVLAVDSFGSRGLGPCPNSLHASPPLQAAYRALSQDAWGGLDFLERQPYVAKGKVALVGFSLGANAINSYLVHRPRTGASNFAAVVGIYGRCHDLRRALVPSMPMMQLAGELDERHVGACRQLLPPVEVHVLPGAYHSWDDPSTNGRTNAYGDASRYSPEATRASRELVRELLARRLRN